MSTPSERRIWRDAIYAVIQVMTPRQLQGEPTIERMCALTGVSRAGYYRGWAASAPRAEETGVRDAIQRLALAHIQCRSLHGVELGDEFGRTDFGGLRRR